MAVRPVTLIERWLRRWREPDAAAAGSVAPAPPASVRIDMAAELSREFPAEFPSADRASRQVLAAVSGRDLSALARRSPGLKGYDWTAYLRCSVARVVRAQRALRLHVAPGARVLDFGSYFGNFALALAADGYAVEAVDGYAEYGEALAPCVALQQQAGIAIHDFATLGYGLEPLHGRYDAIVCAGVIEHIPHTPRLLLETLVALLVPGGILVLDTPNLAYLYRRLALMEGGTTFPPIAQQYYTELPFEGHHREYTVPEVEWMLTAAGLAQLSIETFNYSVFGQSELSGDHVAYFHAMQADPALREIIIAVSRRPANV